MDHRRAAAGHDARCTGGDRRQHGNADRHFDARRPCALQLGVLRDLLTSTACVPIWGRLSDLYGRRRIYLTGVAIFLLGSALAGASGSMVQLILSRAVQGLGAGCISAEHDHRR